VVAANKTIHYSRNKGNTERKTHPVEERQLFRRQVLTKIPSACDNTVGKPALVELQKVVDAFVFVYDRFLLFCFNRARA
jgi:hypothetical protein